MRHNSHRNLCRRSSSYLGICPNQPSYVDSSWLLYIEPSSCPKSLRICCFEAPPAEEIQCAAQESVQSPVMNRLKRQLLWQYVSFNLLKVWTQPCSWSLLFWNVGIGTESQVTHQVMMLGATSRRDSSPCDGACAKPRDAQSQVHDFNKDFTLLINEHILFIPAIYCWFLMAYVHWTMCMSQVMAHLLIWGLISRRGSISRALRAIPSEDHCELWIVLFHQGK